MDPYLMRSARASQKHTFLDILTLHIQWTLANLN